MLASVSRMRVSIMQIGPSPPHRALTVSPGCGVQAFRASARVRKVELAFAVVLQAVEAPSPRHPPATCFCSC